LPSALAWNASFLSLDLSNEIFRLGPVRGVESIAGFGDGRIDLQQEISLYQPVQGLTGFLQVDVDSLLQQSPPSYAFESVDRSWISQEVTQHFIRQTGHVFLFFCRDHRFSTNPFVREQAHRQIGVIAEVLAAASSFKNGSGKRAQRGGTVSAPAESFPEGVSFLRHFPQFREWVWFDAEWDEIIPPVENLTWSEDCIS